MDNYWTNKRVCVTGGAAMIGAKLIERLVELNVRHLWCVDDLSSGRKENVSSDIDVWKCDLRDYRLAKLALESADIVFHLANAHGGRGFVDNHRIECFGNLELDTAVLRAAREVGVNKFVFASSACVYPIAIQQDLESDLKLTEDLVDYNNLKQPDGAYGWAKLLCEAQMDTYAEGGYFDTVACRFFTVYGERVRENHAIGALIAKTFIHQDPFEIWGNGLQRRNWTYVGDTVNGMILAAEKMKRGAVNIGREDYSTPREAAKIICDYLDWHPKQVNYLTDKPVGTLNRVADSKKARTLLGWFPRVTFREGLHKTIDWYTATHRADDVKASLEKSLTER